eukprot:TRINITY_DN17409_c0_g1_i1.p1 TRINITY_DN17409_c0_g1~~TRINITY_DN17409_c0_g1_i1.p1  ORF type:complete len:456 (+),score=123.48 TRINITY_DN17409_c0_g1_i1:43-1410(+)
MANISHLIDCGVFQGTQPDFNIRKGSRGIIPFVGRTGIKALSCTCKVMNSMLSGILEHRHTLQLQLTQKNITLKKEIFNNKRAALDLQTMHLMDANLYKLFSKFREEQEDDKVKSLWKQMKKLFQGGAATICFIDYELAGDNICSFFVDDMVEKQQSDVYNYKAQPYKYKYYFKFLSESIVCGTQWTTNKRYAGNGGITLDYFLINFFGTGFAWGNTYKNACAQKDYKFYKMVFKVFLEMMMSGVPFNVKVFDMVKKAKDDPPKIRDIQRRVLRTCLEVCPCSNYYDDYYYVADLFICFSDTRRMDLLSILADHLKALPTPNEEEENTHFVAFLRGDGKNFNKLMKEVTRFGVLLEPFLPSLFFYFLLKKKKKIIQQLLSTHSHLLVHSRNKEGYTPLLFMCGQRGSVLGYVKMLLLAGSDVNATNNHNQGPIEIAQQLNNHKVVSFLRRFLSKI